MLNKKKLEQTISDILSGSFQISTNNILNKSLDALNAKERNIIKNRYGLKNPNKQTLKKLGDRYGLTRERIRQIENIAIGKMKKAEFDDDFYKLKSAISHFLIEHGGFLEKKYLFFLLEKISNYNEDIENDIKTNHFDFIFSKFLADDFAKYTKSNLFHDYYKINSYEIEHFEELASEILNIVKEKNDLLKIEELLKIVLELDTYKKYKHKMPSQYYIKDKDYIYNQHIVNDIDFINQNKALYSLLQTIRGIKFNNFGDWGHCDRNDVIPKTINDKIYLVLKNNKKSMHFSEIADAINKVKFDQKIANKATVHNELILDDRYVLTGRGMYGLKEWGLIKGTVSEFIEKYLKLMGGPVLKDDIIKEVLSKRKVKINTINLALSNSDKFKKEGNYYTLE